jgi:hypothetical protein
VAAVSERNRAWRVRRRWLPLDLPRWRARGGRAEQLLNIADAGSYGLLFADAPALAVVILVILVAIVIVALALLLLPLLLTLVLVLLVGVPLLLVTLVGRVALGRPWRIEAIRDGERRGWDVAGWRESRLAMDELRRSALGGGEPRTSRGRPVAGG